MHIKICCIETEEDRARALQDGVTSLGFVAEGLTPPYLVSIPRAATLREGLPRRIEAVLLTAETCAETLVSQARDMDADAIQLCRPVSPQTLAHLRTALPGVRLIGVIHMGDPGGPDRAAAIAESVDIVLLDSGSLQTSELGGTGRTHDWKESARVRDVVRGELWLAGGLRPDNVGAAITLVRPDGVDVCSGVRTNGRVDPAKVRAFVAAARESGEKVD
jgi:phosphoribosylanthranilate isomerase